MMLLSTCIFVQFIVKYDCKSWILYSQQCFIIICTSSTDPIVVYGFDMQWRESAKSWYALFQINLTDPTLQQVNIRCCHKLTKICTPNVRHVPFGPYYSYPSRQMQYVEKKLPFSLMYGPHDCFAAVWFQDQTEGPPTNVVEIFSGLYYHNSIMCHMHAATLIELPKHYLPTSTMADCFLVLIPTLIPDWQPCVSITP